MELGPRHDELFPAWLHLAEKQRHSIDFFVAPLHQSRDIFSLLESPRPRWFLTKSQDLGNSPVLKILQNLRSMVLRLRALFLLNTNYDLVIANSVEPENYHWSFFRYINKPILTVLHNGNVVVTNKKYENIRTKSKYSVVVLSKHIQEYLARHDVASFPIHPYLELKASTFENCQKHETTFCVQGYMHLHRRNYDSLLKAASSLKERKVKCTFKIVGRLNRSARHMQERIKELEISEYFAFVSDAVSYRDYYREIYSCRFLLLLIDDSRMIYQPFFEDKCSSSLHVALGLDVIPVANRKLSEIYEIADCCVPYESDDVYSGVMSALSYESKEIDSLVDGVQRTRQRFADESVSAFGRAIESATGG